MKKLNYSKLYAFALTFWFTISGVQAAHAAINRTVAFGISERLRPDNSFYYTLGVGDSPFPPIVLDDRVEQFVLPGGTDS